MSVPADFYDMTSFFSKFAALFTGIRSFSWQRETVVLAAMVMLMALAAVLFVVDGYVLSRSHLRAPVSITPARKGALLTEQDIDDALNLLDARAKKMNAILDEK